MCFDPILHPPGAIDIHSTHFKEGLTMFQDFAKECCETATDGTVWVSRPELAAAYAMYVRLQYEKHHGKPLDQAWAYRFAWSHIPYFLPELNNAGYALSLHAAPLMSPYSHDVYHQLIVGIKLLRFPTM